MKVYQKQWQQVVPAPLDRVWAFFSRPENLQNITPSDMQFEILSDVANVDMHPGMMIQYRVTPFPSFKTTWLTEITALDYQKYFIDEQRSGPFKLWHHQHHFKEVSNGTKMVDILHYGLPLGPLGQLIDSLVVSHRIERIFEYRESVIPQFFPT